MVGVSSVAGIEIVDVRRLGEPELPTEFVTNDPRMEPGFARVAWIDRDTILYNRTPLYWRVNVREGTFSHIVDIEEHARQHRSSSAIAVKGADAAVVRYGRLSEAQHGFYSTGTGWISTDEHVYHRLRIRPTFDSDVPGLVNDWEYRLLGGHAIVPRPVYGSDDVGFSLRHAETGELQLLPPGFFEFRDIGSAAFAAVSFDRFHIALVAGIVRREETDPYDWGWNLWVMRVVYDGAIRIADELRSEPSWESPAVGRLDADTAVRVHDADRYTVTESGEEDFWYQVKHEGGFGWIFGTSLIIEGENWQERLDDRGRPLDVEAIFGEAAAESPCK